MKKEQEYILLKDLTIPAGTKLSRACNELGGYDNLECIVGIGKDFAGTFIVTKCGIEDAEGFIAEIN